MSGSASAASAASAPSPPDNNDNDDAKMSKEQTQAYCAKCLHVVHDLCMDSVKEMDQDISSTKRPSQADLAAAAQSLSHSVNKLALFVARNPDRETVQTMTDDIAKNIVHFACLLRALLRYSGTTWRKEIVAAGRSIVGGIAKVVDSLFPVVRGGAKPSPHLAGAVMQQCGEVRKLPTSNFQATSKAMLTPLSMIKDARTEVNELCEEHQQQQQQQAEERKNDKDNASSSVSLTGQTNAAGSDDVVDGDGDFDDPIWQLDDGMDDELSAEEYARAKVCADVTAVAFMVVKRTMMFLAHCHSQVAAERDEDDKDTVEDLLARAKAIAVAVDEVGSSLYPPQDVDTIRTAVATTMKESVAAIVDTLRTHPQFAPTFERQASKTSEQDAAQLANTWCDGVLRKLEEFNKQLNS